MTASGSPRRSPELARSSRFSSMQYDRRNSLYSGSGAPFTMPLAMLGSILASSISTTIPAGPSPPTRVPLQAAGQAPSKAATPQGRPLAKLDAAGQAPGKAGCRRAGPKQSPKPQGRPQAKLQAAG